MLLTVAFENSVTLHVVADRNNRRTKKGLAGFLDIADYATLGADCSVVGNLYMACNADLTGQDAVFANFCRTGYTALGSHNRILTYHYVVSNLAKCFLLAN